MDRTAPSKLGYTFKGWTVTFSDGTPNILEPTFFFSISSGTTGAITLAAHWSLNTYTLTYYLAGGSYYDEPVSFYTILDLPIIINPPTKTGYNFLDWTVKYTDNSGGI